jgi:hydroxymethylglutaryl-CoA lyase
MRNTNTTIEESLLLLDRLVEYASGLNRELVVYLSMGFGNPYGDPWSPTLVAAWVSRLVDMGVKRISLSDTVGLAQPNTITDLFEHLLEAYPDIVFGAHLHAKPNEATLKIKAAYAGGCRAFDSAIRGLGGCPMAKDELTGNVPTEKLLSFLTAKKAQISVNMLHFESAYNASLVVC